MARRRFPRSCMRRTAFPLLQMPIVSWRRREAFTLVELPAVSRRKRAAFTLVELPAVSRRKRAAFTLVELLVVIGVATVIMSLLLATLTGARESARRTACLSNLHQIGRAIVMYANDNKGMFPSSALGGSAFQSDDWIWWRTADRVNIREGGIGRYL